jgi:hypothetical protein
MGHTHYYDRALSAWQCRECDAAVEDCSADPIDEEIELDRDVLVSARAVAEDQNEGRDDDERMTMREAVLHARNVLRLPEEAPVAGAVALDEDGSPLAASYRLVLSMPDAVLAELPEHWYSDDDMEWLRVCLKDSGVLPYQVDMGALMFELFELVTDMADGETGYAEREDADWDGAIARHTFDTSSSGSSQHYVETGRYLTRAEVAELAGLNPRIGSRVRGNGFEGRLEGFARDGQIAVIVGDDRVSSRRVPIASLEVVD